MTSELHISLISNDIRYVIYLISNDIKIVL